MAHTGAERLREDNPMASLPKISSLISPAEQPKLYRFGEFELGTLPIGLTRNGRRIELQPQPARALELLVRNRGRVVSREMLRLHLWGDGTYLDHEQGINFALRKIRIALGDSPSAPRYVETVPRAGYRFVAPVEMVRVQDVPHAALQPQETPKTPTVSEAGASTMKTSGTINRRLLGRYGRGPVASGPTYPRGCRSRGLSFYN